MIISLTLNQLESYLGELIKNHIPDGWISYSFGSFLQEAMERVEFCFSHIHRKYYSEKGKVVFNHLNTDHMASLLYFLENTIWQSTGSRTPDSLVLFK